ncbi:MAG: acetoin utilization protein AcuC [Nocardioides sp.]
MTQMCSGPATVVFQPDLTEYDFGPRHPMAPVRIDLTMRLAEAVGLLGGSDSMGCLRIIPAPVASAELIASVHDHALIEAVMAAGSTPGRANHARGLGTADNPIFAGMHLASAHVVGATVEACRQVWTGESTHSVNVCGGLHHAMRGVVSGFCVYNDLAVGIQWLLDHGARRVAYVDIDVHHGDGVQEIFYDDPRVLTISLHESGRELFPWTGFAEDLGGPGALGMSVNVPVPAGTGDADWLRAFDAVVPPLLREFSPDVLVTQHGCDSHRDDPLADLMLTVDGQRAAYLALHQLAHDVCGGKWVVSGGGGYAVVDVVPRAWTHLLAIVGGYRLDPDTEIPESWRGYVREHLGAEAPRLFTDGASGSFRRWTEEYDPASAVDRAVAQTRDAVFPWHGLDPRIG